MKRPVVLAIISLTALSVAVVFILGPKDKSLTKPLSFSSSEEAAEETALQKIPRKKKKQIAGIDLDYLEAFRKCNQGLKEFCDVKPSVPEGDIPAGKKSRSTAGLPPLDNNRAEVFQPIMFNELMVKTATTFAQRKGHCRKQNCGPAFNPASEQGRIYRKILKEAHTGCKRRQLDACEIQADILAAEGQYSEARDVLATGVRHAQTVVSRCDSGHEQDKSRCHEGRIRHESFHKKSKMVQETMLQVH